MENDFTNEVLFAASLRKFLESSREMLVDHNRDEKDFKEEYNMELDGTFSRHIIECLGNISGKKLLDIGSGSGWQAVALGLQGAEVYGIEPAPGGAEAGRYRALRYKDRGIKATFDTGVNEQLPYPENFFDFVLSFHCIEHVQDVDRSLREMYRVLKPGGRLYIEVSNYMYPREEHYRLYWIPNMPKWLGRPYVRLMGKSTVLLDNLNYIFKRPLVLKMRAIGFQNVHDKYEQYVWRKFENVATIRNRSIRAVCLLLQKLGILTIFCRVVIWAGFYPALWISGEK